MEFSEEELSKMPEGVRISIEKTLKELAEAENRQKRVSSGVETASRQWKHPQGYKYLIPYKNSVMLREKVRAFTKTLPKSEHRLKAQLDDAARSVKRNIEEGYKRPTTDEYLFFLGCSQGSLEEVKGDIRDCLGDGFIGKKDYDDFIELINKTDYLLRRLVYGLERKIGQEPGGYHRLMKLKGIR